MNARQLVWMSFAMLLLTTGCARTKELERVSRQQSATILSLNDEVARLRSQLSQLEMSNSELEAARQELLKKLKSEMDLGNVSVSMTDRGIVVTVQNAILFDSGKADLKNTSDETLQTIGSILKQKATENMVYVEGHTDTDPITRSTWKSNWELSTARATEVLHALSAKSGIYPGQFVAAGYGEYHPVASNGASVGKQKNRRVEIIVSPLKYSAQKAA